MATVTAAALMTALLPAVPAQAAAGDIGYADQLYTGATNPPTADKPQSKLWYNDGSWWAVMFDPTSTDWHIFRLDRGTEKWVDTGTRVDDRPQASADALWDGSTLNIGTQYVTVSDDNNTRPSTTQQARLYRYTYNSSTRTYSAISGSPTIISTNSSESLTIDKDTTGRVWATWTKVGSSSTGYATKVYVNSTGTDGKTWGTPAVLTAPNTNSSVAPDDISGLVAFGKSSGGGGRIGVLWSNHNDDKVYFAIHADGAAAGTWTGGTALSGTKQADDHLNLKTIDADAQGRVVAAVKTSADELSGSAGMAQIKVLVYNGGWTSTTFGTVADCHTRPLVMLDSTNSEIHVFATAPTASGCPAAGTPGTIYEKTTSITSPSFASGRGTPVIRDAANANMNNVTSMKQSVTSATGLVVLASNNSTKRYWHADETLRGGTPTPTAPTAGFNASPTSGTAPLTVSFTNTSTGSPTSYAWNFGDSATSTATSPSHTYTTPGTYTATLTATNASGSDSTSKTITVGSTPPPPPPGGGVTRATTSTNIATTAATTLAVPAPSGTAAGDLLVSCLATNGASVSAAPTGWTRFAASSALANPKAYGYYKVAGSSEPSSYTFTFSSSVTSSGGIARYTGATAIDGTASTASGASSTTATVPGVTTSVDKAAVVGCMSINSASTSVTITKPSGTDQAWDLGGKRQEVADNIQDAAGASGSRSWTLSSGREWAGWVAAVR